MVLAAIVVAILWMAAIAAAILWFPHDTQAATAVDYAILTNFDTSPQNSWRSTTNYATNSTQFFSAPSSTLITLATLNATNTIRTASTTTNYVRFRLRNNVTATACPLTMYYVDALGVESYIAAPPIGCATAGVWCQVFMPYPVATTTGFGIRNTNTCAVNTINIDDVEQGLMTDVVPPVTVSVAVAIGTTTVETATSTMTTTSWPTGELFALMLVWAAAFVVTYKLV